MPKSTASMSAAPAHKPTFKETMTKLRYTKSVRVAVLAVLFLILLAMYFIGGKMKWLLLVLMVVVLGALGMQITDYDLDLETLWKTGSVQESRVETKRGVKVIGSACVWDNLNCSNFASQTEAQAKYEMCADKIASDNNKDKAAVRNLDVYGLDGDKDGVVCEALQKGNDQTTTQMPKQQTEDTKKNNRPTFDAGLTSTNLEKMTDWERFRKTNSIQEIKNGCYEVVEIFKNFINLNVHWCEKNSIGWYAVAVTTSEMWWFKQIYKGQDVMPCETIKKRNVPREFTLSNPTCYK